MVQVYKPQQHTVAVITYSGDEIARRTAEDEKLKQECADMKVQIKVLEHEYSLLLTKIQNQTRYDEEYTWYDMMYNSKITETMDRQLSNLNLDIEKLYAQYDQLKGKINANQAQIDSINRFLTDLTLNPQVLFEQKLVELELVINDYENLIPNQSYELRLCLYTLKTQLESFKNLTAPENYFALNRLLWLALQIVGMYQVQELNCYELTHRIAILLQGMHLAEDLKNITLTDGKECELPPLMNMEQVEHDFKEYEKEHYQAALANFKALKATNDDPATVVVTCIESNEYETADWKFLTRVLNLQTYIAAPNEEHLRAVQTFDSNVTDKNSALIRYFDCADVAIGAPHNQTLAKAMLAFGVFLLLAALALVMVTTSSLFVPTVIPIAAILMTATIACSSVGAITTIGGAGLGFFGRRKNLSKLMLDYAEDQFTNDIYFSETSLDTISNP